MQPVTPAAWNVTKRKQLGNSEPKRNKRVKVETENNVQYLSNVVELQLRKKKDQKDQEASIYDITSLLESIPFVNMLADVTGDPIRDNLPVVSRVYEEQYMRQCLNDRELPCVMNASCECMYIDRKNPFVGVQFPLPGISAENNNMCVLCLRKTTQLLFYQAVHCGFKVKGLIQKYGNICSEPGEYDKSVMLICPPHGPMECLPLPIVAHQRNRYKVIKKNDVLWILQVNVFHEDFT